MKLKRKTATIQFYSLLSTFISLLTLLFVMEMVTSYEEWEYEDMKVAIQGKFCFRTFHI